MNPQQIHLVRSSFALVEPIAPQAAALFYRHLFQADPSLRSLFVSNMEQQGERLMRMIASAIGLLERSQSLDFELRKLGARHLGYGVHARHYETVGDALLQTLEEGLGMAFTPEVRNAWAALYQSIASTMLEGARAPALAR